MTPTKKTTEKSDKPVAAKKQAAAKKVVAAKVAAPVEVEAKTDAVVSEEKTVIAGSAAPVMSNALMAEALGPMKDMKEGEYIYAIGRRKQAVAKVKVWTNGKGEVTVNGKPHDKFFTVYELIQSVTDPLRVVGVEDRLTIEAKASGGGMRGQAEAIRLGISRALVELNPNYRKSLKKLGYMMRDPRVKERKHYGLKKARKASQWAKR